ncbi:MAG: glycosyltransferase [Bacteroidota bacterium]
MWLNLFILAFVGATLVQLYFWWRVFRPLAHYPVEEERASAADQVPVSVIICARNEAKNLQKNLPRILNQNYRSFEVIVVNDQSNDDTTDILLESLINNPILCIIHLREKPAGRFGKKFALARGIAAARYDHLLLTDADCCPASEDWLYHMQRKIRGPLKIGLGYGPYRKYPGWLNAFIRYETFYTAIQYLSFALAGRPYMGVGRNLIYRKGLFDEVGGFQEHIDLASGDDDLFVQAAADAHNTTLILNSSTFCYSEPKRTWRTYVRQKTRHLTTGKHYTTSHKMLLGALSLSHFVHFLGGFVLIVKFSTIFVISLYVVRITSVMWTSRLLLKRLNDPSLWKWIPLLDLAFLFYYLLFAPVLMTGNTKRWK